MVEILFYECSPRPFFVPDRQRGYRGRVGDLDVIEHRHRSKVLPYGLRMECQVTTKEQAARCDTEARQLARDLNIVWPYVAIVPLFPKWIMMQLSGAPDGWRTNFKKLKSTRPRRSSRGKTPGPAVAFSVSIKIPKGRNGVRLPYMPLKPALEAVRAYRTANANIKVLMSLHFGAIDLLGTESQLLLLAKALDLAEDMLPGHGKDKQQAALPCHVSTELSRSLHWLGEMSNHRLETRHASHGTLWPKLNLIERRDFIHDADLVIRGMVERELGIVALTKW